ncbi:MAG: CvpA family protein [Bacteroidota bacterium]|jgi:membrane protein required for colicin V production
MNFLDIIILVPMIWYGFKGYRKGLIFEIAGIVALIAGTWIAINFSNKVAEFIGLTGKYVDIISFVITFAAVIFLVFAFAKFIEKAVTLVIPEFLNNIGGLVLGALKIALIASILLYFITSMDKYELFLKKDIKAGSLLFKPVSSIAPVLFPEFRSIKDSVSTKEIEAKKNSNK